MLRLELPGWGRLARRFNILGADADPHWCSAPVKRVRGKWHGFTMSLNLADWSERQTWFLGRYSELAGQLLMARCIRRGDRVVDVGANIGMMALHAASLVGPEGLVEAFEPNPACCHRIQEAVAANSIRQIRLHPMGLSDGAGTLRLKVLLNHTGMGTLAEVPEHSLAMVTSSVEVPIATGDSVLLQDDRPITFVKMDVEGFEPRALAGMAETLKRWWPIVTTEVVNEWLERAGSSSAALSRMMAGLGYEGFALSTSRRRLAHVLRLTPLPVASVPAHVTDVAWIPTQGETRRRLSDAL